LVTAKIVKNSGKYSSFECKGHAEYDGTGFDIVCAAISILTINTANSICCLTDTVIEPEEDYGYIYWKFNDDIGDDASLLMDSMLLGFKTIEDNYKNEKYLTLIIEEV